MANPAQTKTRPASDSSTWDTGRSRGSFIAAAIPARLARLRCRWSVRHHRPPRRARRDPAARAQAVPRLRRRDAGNLVGGRLLSRARVEEDAEVLHAGRFELANDELAPARGGAPVDAAQRVAGLIWAHPEHLAAITGARRCDAGFELAHKRLRTQRGESGQHQSDLAVLAALQFVEQAQRIPAFEPPVAHLHRSATQWLQQRLLDVAARLAHDAGGH